VRCSSRLAGRMFRIGRGRRPPQLRPTWRESQGRRRRGLEILRGKWAGPGRPSARNAQSDRQGAAAARRSSSCTPQSAIWASEGDGLPHPGQQIGEVRERQRGAGAISQGSALLRQQGAPICLHNIHRGISHPPLQPCAASWRAESEHRNARQPATPWRRSIGARRRAPGHRSPARGGLAQGLAMRRMRIGTHRRRGVPRPGDGPRFAAAIGALRIPAPPAFSGRGDRAGLGHH